MSTFDRMQRLRSHLYRGSHGAPAEAIMTFAVGPVRAVAEHIINAGFDVVASVRDDATEFFLRAIAGAPNVSLPGSTLANRLARLLQLPGTAANPFTVFEHVLYEPQAQINSPRTSLLLESVSENPQVAVLYAYGVHPDPWFENRQITFWRGSRNAQAFVAVLPASTGVPANQTLKRIQNIEGTGGLTVAEAQRRMQRDGEVLLASAVQPRRIVRLPPFDVNDPLGSLDQAAGRLNAQGVVR